jgi:hypothetical protein
MLFLTSFLLAGEADRPTVPDPYGLGYRLALLDYLKERGATIPPDATVEDLIMIFDLMGLRAKPRAKPATPAIVVKAGQGPRRELRSNEEKAIDGMKLFVTYYSDGSREVSFVDGGRISRADVPPLDLKLMPELASSADYEIRLRTIRGTGGQSIDHLAVRNLSQAPLKLIALIGGKSIPLTVEADSILDWLARGRTVVNVRPAR